MKKPGKKSSKAITQQQQSDPPEELLLLSSKSSKVPVTLSQEFKYQKIQSLHANLHDNTQQTIQAIQKFRHSDKNASGIFIMSNDQIKDLVIASKQGQCEEIANQDQSKEQVDKQNQKQANLTVVIIQQPSKEEQ